MKDLENLFNKKADILFDQEYSGALDESDLVKLTAYGMSLGTDVSRPVLLLKDEKGELTLPVPMNPLEAGVTLSQSAKSTAPSTTHKVTQTLLESMKIKIESCVFVEIKGHHQYVKLKLQGHPFTDSLKVRADEAMSLCLYLETPIYSTREFIQKSRVLNAEMEGVEKGVMVNREMLVKKHNYIM